MIRYHLDDLGWFQFESLVQSLLKAQCGLGVESWGDSSDHGRDAFCTTALKFPGSEENAGPFLFQVKFVQGANGAGASANASLEKAVAAECSSIRKRQANNLWTGIKHYSLVTNAPISADLRKKLTAKLSTANAGDQIHIFQGTDVCDLLDAHDSVRRAYPQLLSVRDLELLIQRQINRNVAQRSQAALDEARDLVSVFVPTAAYDRAFETLSKSHFVVLEGPPEMGKSAIAWMLAMVQISCGWQAVVCSGPNDFLGLYDANMQQIFIADDAFGRTEYDPARGKQWEQELSKILFRLDSNHWLVWTTRKHILERAVKKMDLQGSAYRFPKPGDIFVDSSRLSTSEKALILYRHAKAANLELEARQLVKRYAEVIVRNPNFTPERIRLLISDAIPNLQVEIKDSRRVQKVIMDVLERPTERVRKTFRNLSLAHKKMLFKLLEAGHIADTAKLRRLYESSEMLAEDQTAFEDVLDELSEAFVRIH